MTVDLAPVAHGYNKPDRATDLEASFLDLGSAQAYAAQYGGNVEARGVAFVVRDADHDQARDDLAAAQARASQPAPAVTSDIDAAVERAVARERENLRAEFEAERAALAASQAAPNPEPTPAS